MRVILNPKHAEHAPPGEVGRRRGDSVLRSAAASPRSAPRSKPRADSRSRSRPSPSEECVAAVHHAGLHHVPARSQQPRRTVLATAAAKQLWPTVFPFGPNPRATGTRAFRGQYCFDTYTPILPGTFAAALGGANAAARARPRLSPRKRTKRLRADTAARPPRRTRPLRRLLLLQQRRGRGRTTRETGQGRDTRSRRASRQRHATHLLRTARTCSRCPSTATRPGCTRSSAASPTKPAKARGMAST